MKKQKIRLRCVNAQDLKTFTHGKIYDTKRYKFPISLPLLLIINDRGKEIYVNLNRFEVVEKEETKSKLYPIY